jgi:hypothetical protein
MPTLYLFSMPIYFKYGKYMNHNPYIPHFPVRSFGLLNLGSPKTEMDMLADFWPCINSTFPKISLWKFVQCQKAHRSNDLLLIHNKQSKINNTVTWTSCFMSKIIYLNQLGDQLIPIQRLLGE